MNRTLAHTTSVRTKLAGITVAALTATAVGVTISTVCLDAPASAQGHGHTATMHYVLRQGQFAMDDLGETGEGLGDIMVQTSPVTQHGKTVGSVHDVAVAVDAKKGLFQANGSLVLSGGTIEFAGLVSQTPHFTMAITGGTGTYEGAAGNVSFAFPGKRQLLNVTVKH